MSGRILLVEDDPFLREGLEELFAREAYQVTTARCAREADAHARERTHDLIILDVTLPDGDGVSLCRSWRNAGVTTPILFLTARDDEMDIVRGLDSGGNDYVTKPFRMLELLSRMRALLRRDAPPTARTVGDLEIDMERMTVRRAGQQLYLTPTELRILHTLMRGTGRIVTRGLLLESIWDAGGQFIDDNTLTVHISRLRDKIGAEHIRTIRGVGYQWED